VPTSTALRQGPHIKVATVASRWQRVGDLMYPEFESHTSSVDETNYYKKLELMKPEQ